MINSPKIIPKDLINDIKSLKEEKANMISHLFGVLFWVLTAPLIIYKIFHLENIFVIIGLIIYVISFLMLFSFSTLYHNSYNAKTRIKLRKLDHISIYFFIAGTYTPLILIFVNNNFGYIVLFLLWFATLFGTVFKLFFIGKFRVISTVIYLLMGWTALFIASKLLETMPLNIFYWIMTGGVIYTIGTFFYINKKINHNHLIWHLIVLLGAICHYIAMYLSIS